MNVFTMAEGNHVPINKSFPIPLAPVSFSHQSALFVWIYLFWVFYLNRIIWYMAFCLCFISLRMMILRFICVVVYIRIEFLFMVNILWLINYIVWYTTFCLSIHQLIDVWVLPIFWLLWMMLLEMFMYKCLFEYLFFLIFSIYLGMELLGHV